MTHLRLTNFRNLAHLKLDFSQRINLISGANGVGKTNILDAITRLTAPRGLKGQMGKECVNVQKPQYGWGAGIELRSGDVIQYGRVAGRDKMMYHYNKEPMSHNMLRHKVPILWLSPVGEKLFTQEHKDIRRYVDYLISLVFPKYMSHKGDYDKALKQRMKLLQDCGDVQWIKIIEHEIAANALEMLNLREAFLELFSQSYQAIIADMRAGFPPFSLKITDPSLNKENFNTVESYAHTLLNTRSEDIAAGRSLFGIHRSQIQVTHLDKNIDIYYCSTGEQKAIMSHILCVMNHLLQQEGFGAPLMLFDDALAHYDTQRIKFFYNYMLEMCANQFFLTDTMFHRQNLPDNTQIMLFELEKYMKHQGNLCLF